MSQLSGGLGHRCFELEHVTLGPFFGRYNEACNTCRKVVVKLNKHVYSVSPVVTAATAL